MHENSTEFSAQKILEIFKCSETKKSREILGSPEIIDFWDAHISDITKPGIEK